MIETNETATNKQFEIIESESDKRILSEISNFATELIQPISDIQVNKFVLNDIEAPTDYAKLKQVKAELIVRYNAVIDSYYNIRKKELDIELLNEEIMNEPHPIKKKLKALDNEKSVLQLMDEKTRLHTVLYELRIYYKYYTKYNISNLTEEQKIVLEEELWAKKALNDPVVFEERYGGYIKEILGSRYDKYLERRKTTVGNFARELI